MKKRLDLLEHIKTVILVVLFFITILLLYLSFNQNGKSFSVSDILPVGRSVGTAVDTEAFIIPNCTVEAEGSGHYLIAYKNQQAVFERAKECMKGLLSASNITISEISAEEYDRIGQEAKSIQLVFGFDYPFDDLCIETLGKTLEKPEALTGFGSLMFSDRVKSDLYMKNARGCYKLSVAENYYSTEALGEILVFDGEISSDKIASAGKKVLKPELDIIFDNIPENVFGDTLDFVRRIADVAGNETYMYGYGQKRLSLYASGSIEFKEDVGNSDLAKFSTELEAALLFIEEQLGIAPEDIRLGSAEKCVSPEESFYSFCFDVSGGYTINAQLKNARVSYLLLLPEAEAEL